MRLELLGSQRQLYDRFDTGEWAAKMPLKRGNVNLWKSAEVS
jgi:hypothetical protein